LPAYVDDTTFPPKAQVQRALRDHPLLKSAFNHQGKFHRLVAASKKGHINNRILRNLLPFWVKELREGVPPNRWVILLGDGHSSHADEAVLRFLVEHKVAFLGFPSHLTHILQMLDVIIFGILKRLSKPALDQFLAILYGFGFVPTLKVVCILLVCATSFDCIFRTLSF
jgi:hypothetical protein